MQCRGKWENLAIKYLEICQQKVFGKNKFGDYTEKEHFNESFWWYQSKTAN